MHSALQSLNVMGLCRPTYTYERDIVQTSSQHTAPEIRFEDLKSTAATQDLTIAVYNGSRDDDKLFDYR